MVEGKPSPSSGNPSPEPSAVRVKDIFEAAKEDALTVARKAKAQAQRTRRQARRLYLIAQDEVNR